MKVKIHKTEQCMMCFGNFKPIFQENEAQLVEVVERVFDYIEKFEKGKADKPLCFTTMTAKGFGSIGKYFCLCPQCVSKILSWTLDWHIKRNRDILFRKFR